MGRRAVTGLEKGNLRVPVRLARGGQDIARDLRVLAALGERITLTPDHARGLARVIEDIREMKDEIRRVPGVLQFEYDRSVAELRRMALRWCDAALVVAALHAFQGVLAWI